MGQLRDRMEADLKIAGYSESTRKIYLIYARKFVEHFWRSPAEMGADEVRYYLLHLIEHHGASRETVRQVRSALRFLYAVTLNRPVEELVAAGAPSETPAGRARRKRGRRAPCGRSPHHVPRHLDDHVRGGASNR